MNSQRQLAFINSIMESSALPRRLLEHRVSCNPTWALTLTNTKKTRSNNFHIRFLELAGCDSLEADASRFRQRQNGRSPNDPSCKLCEALLEDSLHVKEALPDPACNPDRFFNLIFGVEWLSDTDAQLYFVDFLNDLKSHRNSLLVDQ